MTTATAPPKTEPKPSDPLGVAEVADLLDVERRTVHQWSYRGLLPAPDFTVNALPAWKRSTVTRWARDTGRLPKP